jgi:hypothetical protein
MENNPRRFYVYRYRIIETKEVIYIGKGSGNRYKDVKDRNQFFLSMYNTHNCEVQILCNYMTEEEAFELEKLLISYYRLYSNCRLTNVCDGGQGASGYHMPPEQRARYSEMNSGAGNGNYGHKWTQEMKDSLSQKQKNSGRYLGAQNPNSKKVRCIETGEIFLTMSEAAKSYGLKYPSSIWHALEAPHRLAAGYHWEIVSD